MTISANPRRLPDITLVHSSDLHVDDGYTARAWNGDGTGPLKAVIATARACNADLILLAGDTFEHNRLAVNLLEQAARALRNASCPVVMLPGNHDPLTSDSVWHRGDFSSIGNVFVLGIEDDTHVIPDIGLQIWGRAHRDYGNMSPLAEPEDRSETRYIVAGHGHFIEAMPVDGELAPSWLITEEQIEATGADYVALGHWNRSVRVGNGVVPAHYSGSPDLAKTVNLVRFMRSGSVQVTREPLCRGHPDR